MDETTKDVVPAEGGGQVKPNLDASTKSEKQDSPGGESQIEALSQQVKELSGMVRALQSDKDKGVARVSRELDDLSETLKRYYKRWEDGQSFDQALKEEVLEDLVAERMGPRKDTKVPSEEDTAYQPKVAIEEVLSPLLEASGLKDTDADVIEILRTEKDTARRIIAISNLINSRKQAQTEPNPAAALSSGGGEAIEGESLDSITAELNELLSKPVTPEIREKIRELGRKQKALLPKG